MTNQKATIKVRQTGKARVDVIITAPSSWNYRQVQAEAHKLAAKALEFVADKWAYKGDIHIEAVDDHRAHVVFETMDEYDTLCALSVTRALNLSY